MANEELVMHAREFTESPNLGKSIARDLDKAMIYIRELADALEAAEALREKSEHDLKYWRRRYQAMHKRAKAAEARVKELEAQAKDHKAEQIFRISELQELGEAQARIAELETGGWEYEVRNEVHRFRSDLTPDFEQANRWAQEDPHDFIVRRRKAGPWLPVEGESK